MLDRNATLRWLSMLLGCALALSWAACESTETGNPPALPDPPRVDLGRFDLSLGDEGLLVIGGKGAVDPGGSTVEVTELVSGARASVKSEADGSFRMLISGAQSVQISVRAWSDGGETETSSPATASSPKQPTQADQASDAGSVDSASLSPSEAGSAPVSDAAADARPLDAGTSAAASDAQSALATCEQLDLEAQRRIDALRDAATCGDTCQQIPTRSSCFASCDIQVDAEAIPSVMAALALLEQEVCAPRATLSCAPHAERCDARGWPCMNDACTLPSGPSVDSVVRDQ